MIGPTWLAGILGAIMIVAAVGAAARIVVARRTHRPTDVEVDVHNVVMGVSMAGMLVPSLLLVTAGASTIAWIAVWIVITVWFAFSVVRDARREHGGRLRNGKLGGHHLPHLVMSGAMIYMLAASRVGVGDAGAGMSGMSPGSSLVAVPTLDYAFLIFMVGYAVLVIDRLPVIAVVGSGDLRVVGRARSRAATSTGPLAPRTAAATNILMALTMGYMLTMMFV